MANRRSRFSLARFSCFGGKTRVETPEDGYPVKLHINDLSQGMARQLSRSLAKILRHFVSMIQGSETLRVGAARQRPQLKPAPAAATQPSSSSIHVQPNSSAADKTATDNAAGNGSRIPPSAAAEAPVVSEVSATATPPVDKAAENGSRIPPAVQPSPSAAAAEAAPVVAEVSATETPPVDKAADNGSRIPPAVQPSPSAAAEAPAVAKASSTATPPVDPLREAKNRAQEEIKREFAAIMATGTMKAGEAAAHAVRRVMERHGVQRAAAGVQRG
ncbi:hypothetical protein GUJ93_ZPchr0012g21963 [Zizania palustris]|uniref:Uncharacterized protein n=1 Tax=Zizania palustris TaxID=103762 RepID=A0A8J6BSG0_ZIZPA|nr:hypothetical protein GUJ93_ZPchr0012g21963 [Zizania palustris]